MFQSSTIIVLIFLLWGCATQPTSPKQAPTEPASSPVLNQTADYVCTLLQDQTFSYDERFDPDFRKALPEAKFKHLLGQFKKEHGKCVRLERLIEDGQSSSAFYRTDKDRLVKIFLNTNADHQVITGLWFKGEVSAQQDLERFSQFLCRSIKSKPKLNYEEMFHSTFRDVIRSEQLIQILAGLHKEFGDCREAVLTTSDGVDGDIKTIHAKDKQLSFLMNLTRENGVLKISGLRYTGPVAKAVSFKSERELYQHVKSIPGEFSLFFEDLNGGTLLSHQEDKLHALGSVFKLYVLGALMDQVKMGKAKWSTKIKIQERHKSLPSGNMQNLKANTLVSLYDLAKNMISISDNTATDHLIAFVGAKNIEEFMAKEKLNSALKKNTPFLTTFEMFKTRAFFSEQDVARYNYANRESRYKLIAALGNPARASVLKKLEGWDKPRNIKDIEWFATPREICTVISWISLNADEEALKILSVNTPFIDLKKEHKLSYVGYKGGSEPGVLEMAYWLKDQQQNEYCLYLGVNDIVKIVDEAAFFATTQGVIEYIHKNLIK